MGRIARDGELVTGRNCGASIRVIWCPQMALLCCLETLILLLISQRCPLSENVVVLLLLFAIVLALFKVDCRMNLSDDAGSLEWYQHPDGSANGSYIIYHSECSRPDAEDGQCRCGQRETFYPRMNR